MEVELRQKEIRFSSRTRAATDQFKQMQLARRTMAKLLEKLPKDLLQTPEVESLSKHADEKVYNLIQLIYRSKNYEGCSKDYEFSRRTMEEHWKAGYRPASVSACMPYCVASNKTLYRSRTSPCDLEVAVGGAAARAFGEV